MNVDDPKLTAYALNELDESERTAIARATADSPEAKRFVAETQELVRVLRSQYRLELQPGLVAPRKLTAIQDDAFWSKAGPLAIAALAVVIRPQEESAAGASVPFAQVKQVVDRRCAACHSSNPTLMNAAPRGIKLDTAEEIKAQASAIEQQAVTTKAMPLGNVTKMTQAERDLLGRWISQGAKIP